MLKETARSYFFIRKLHAEYVYRRFHFVLGIIVSFFLVSVLLSTSMILPLAYAQQDHNRTIKFIEWRFNIPALTTRDLHANNLVNAFSFNQNADSPHIVPLNKTQLNAIRPYMGLQKTAD